MNTWIYCSSFGIIRYGLPFISKNNTLVTVINGTGAVIESIYVLIFILHAPKKEKAKILGLVTFVLAAFSSVALVSVFALHGKTRRYFCGFAAAIFSVIMYGSPLSIMVCIHFSDLIPALSSPVFFYINFRRNVQMTVIRTKSVEYMPFFLSLFVFLCGTSWFVFGLLGNDPFVYVSPSSFIWFLITDLRINCSIYYMFY